MAGRRLTKKPNGPPNNEPAQASCHVRQNSAVRPPNGPLNSHPVDETTRRLIKAATRQGSRRNRQLTVVEVPRADAPGRHDVIPQGPTYLVWNDPEARMLRAGETGGESRLPLPPQGGSAERQESPRGSRDDREDKETRGRHTDEQPARPSNFRRRPSQKLERSISSLRSKYRVGEAQSRAPPLPSLASLLASSRASTPSVDNVQSPQAMSGGAANGASAQGLEADQPMQRRPSLRHRTSQRLPSSCASSVSSDGDESPAAGRERPEETEVSQARGVLDRAVPGNRQPSRRPCPANICW